MGDWMLLLPVLLSVGLVIGLTAWGRVHPLWALLAGCFAAGIGSGMAGPETVSLIGEGLGKMLQQIALIVVFGAMLGIVLEQSGGARALADALLSWTKGRRPALMLTIVGAVVSIPVFCDSGFIILSRLNAAISRQSGVAPATLSLALAGGLYTTHTLVPPTPGPIAAAGNLGASDALGWVMLIGILASVPVVLVVWRWAEYAGPKISADLAAVQASEPELLPAVWRAALPVLIPTFLIGAGVMLPQGNPLKWLTLPSIALAVGVLSALILLGVRQREQWSGWMNKALQVSGPVLIITGMGGAFGAVLKATPLTALAERWVAQGPTLAWMLLPLAWALAVLLKTAQGSSTSALVIASSVVAPLAVALGYRSGVELALLVAALGAGSMMVSHANDSYFWVLSQFGGIKPEDTYRGFSLLTVLMSLTALATVLVLAWIVFLHK